MPLTEMEFIALMSLSLIEQNACDIFLVKRWIAYPKRSFLLLIARLTHSCSYLLYFPTIVKLSTSEKTCYKEIESNYSVVFFFCLEYIINFIYFPSKTFTVGSIFERQLDYLFHRASQEISFSVLNHNFLLWNVYALIIFLLNMELINT